MSTESIKSNDVRTVPEEAIQVIDPNVLAFLPIGIIVNSITPHGASLWTRTARLDAISDGRPIQYFLKVCAYEQGEIMLRGEYTSMIAIHDAVPDLCPRPTGWGTYATNSDFHFYLSEFRHMTNEPPDPVPFAKKMAELHQKGLSPNGKYGFSVPTCHGKTVLEHGWADTWEEYFVTRTRVLFDLEERSQGPSQELTALIEPFLTRVAPRLLRPLETGDRSIQPRLIHGDCWDGNATMDQETGLPIIFDAASFYAHSEYELAVWRAPWNRIDKDSVRFYLEHLGIDQPEEDFDDRVALYATRVNLLDSILYTEDPSYRAGAIGEMKRLVNKYHDGYEGWLLSKQSDQTHR